VLPFPFSSPLIQFPQGEPGDGSQGLCLLDKYTTTEPQLTPSSPSGHRLVPGDPGPHPNA
jgi:hypothetical protein